MMSDFRGGRPRGGGGSKMTLKNRIIEGKIRIKDQMFFLMFSLIKYSKP